MLKPLSPKTLEKKYAALGLSEAKLRLLHTYFRCFSNLYGLIMLREAWEVFKHYEGLSVHRKDFVAFSGIVQREAGLPYSVYELKEVFGGETSEDPLDRLIVNKELVLSGCNRFIYLYALNRRQANKPYYLPEKSVFLSFVGDRFYLTVQGKALMEFIQNLRSGGTMRKFDGAPAGPLLDLGGRPVAGKKLSDIVIYTQPEQFKLNNCKSEQKRQTLAAAFAVAAADKILKRIRLYTMTGGVFDYSMGEDLDLWVNKLFEEYDVSLSAKQFRTLCALYQALNNSSNLWLNCGWTPHNLFHREGPRLPKILSIGRNMSKMLDSGELDLEEFQRVLAKYGITMQEKN